MSILYLDLETLPLGASLDAPYPDAERLPPSNYKNPEAIASWREKDKAAWSEQRVKECSLTPRLGRIACIGYAMDGGDVTVRTAETEAEEVLILDAAWELIEEADRIVTFNGNFDLRFLVVRSMVHRIRPHATVGKISDWFRRYSTHPHFDVRAVLTGWDDRATGKLHEWCDALGVPCPDQTTGGDIYTFAQQGNWLAVINHCRSDVEATRGLFQCVAPVFDRSAA
jgi:hypothetical protein